MCRQHEVEQRRKTTTPRPRSAGCRGRDRIPRRVGRFAHLRPDLLRLLQPQHRERRPGLGGEALAADPGRDRRDAQRQQVQPRGPRRGVGVGGPLVPRRPQPRRPQGLQLPAGLGVLRHVARSAFRVAHQGSGRTCQALPGCPGRRRRRGPELSAGSPPRRPSRRRVFEGRLAAGAGVEGAGPAAFRGRMGVGTGPVEISRVDPRLGPRHPPALRPEPGAFPHPSGASRRPSRGLVPGRCKVVRGALRGEGGRPVYSCTCNDACAGLVPLVLVSRVQWRISDPAQHLARPNSRAPNTSAGLGRARSPMQPV